MILGLGTDIVRTSRIASLQKQYKARFLNRILTQEERTKFDSLKPKEQTKYITKRFAAKEALVKALGVGFNGNISFQDISVVNDKHGKPYYNPSPKLHEYILHLFSLKRYVIHLSISDDIGYANATAILEKIE